MKPTPLLLTCLIGLAGPMAGLAQPTVQFSASSYTVAESAGAVTLTVQRTGDTNTPVSVDFATADGTATNGIKYTEALGTLTFGNGVTSQTILVPILDNGLVDGTKNFRVILRNPTGGAILGTRTNALLSITSNDVGLQFSYATTSVTEDAGAVLIHVVRGDDGALPVMVDFVTTDLTATNGRDYTGITNTLSFAPGDKVKLVTVPILNDGVKEGIKGFRVTLSNPTGGAVLGSRTTTTVTILDNDPGLGFELSSYAVEENAGASILAVLRGNDLALGPLSVNYATSNLTAQAGQDYQAVSGTLAFGENETVKTIPIPILRDGLVMNNTSFRVTLSNPTGVATLGTASTTVNILNASELGTFQTVAPAFDTALRIQREGDVNLLTWGADGPLQRADRPTGPWQTLTTATNPLTVQSPLPATFYRVARPRPVNVYVPSSYDGQTPLPLVILLHYYNNTGAGQENYMQFRSLAETRGFLYCYPDGTISRIYGARAWNGTDYCCDDWSTGDYRTGINDAGYFRALIEEIGSQFSVDRKRVHLVGHSNGGFMAYRMACDSADLIAGIASLAGATFLDPSQCTPSEPVNILHIHGAADQTISYAGGGLPAYPGALQNVQIWAGYNGATGPVTDPGSSMNLSLDVPGLDTVITRYTNAPPGGAVELWTINGGNHIPTFYSGSSASEFAPRVIDCLHPSLSQ